jgi:hypothetical protein
MAVLFIIGLIQVILFALDTGFIVPKKSDLSHKAVSTFYAVTILLMIIAACGFVFSLLLRYYLKEEDNRPSTPRRAASASRFSLRLFRCPYLFLPRHPPVLSSCCPVLSSCCTLTERWSGANDSQLLRINDGSSTPPSPLLDTVCQQLQQQRRQRTGCYLLRLPFHHMAPLVSSPSHSFFPFSSSSSMYSMRL